MFGSFRMVMLFLATTLVLLFLAVSQFSKPSPLFAGGQLVLKEDLREAARGIRDLFIVVYDDSSVAPPPMPFGAYKTKITQDAQGGVFYDFDLTQDNLRVMNEAIPIPKTLRVKARLDKAGKAGPDKPGDIVGEIRGVAIGSKGLKVELDKVIL